MHKLSILLTLAEVFDKKTKSITIADLDDKHEAQAVRNHIESTVHLLVADNYSISDIRDIAKSGKKYLTSKSSKKEIGSYVHQVLLGVLNEKDNGGGNNE